MVYLHVRTYRAILRSHLLNGHGHGELAGDHPDRLWEVAPAGISDVCLPVQLASTDERMAEAAGRPGGEVDSRTTSWTGEIAVCACEVVTSQGRALSAKSTAAFPIPSGSC